MLGLGNRNIDSVVCCGRPDSLEACLQGGLICCEEVPNTSSCGSFSLQEQELKAAADGVLSEVRKKQSDTKRMVDILRALEKLRKLRKEAAARKGKDSLHFSSFPPLPPPPS